MAFFSKLAHLSCVKMETNELAYWEAVAGRVVYILLLWHSQQLLVFRGRPPHLERLFCKEGK
jgi:hypothetical protein